MVDNRWNKHDEYDVKPRIRGRVKLPTLEHKLSVVFGDDSLDNELQNNVAITNENPPSANNDKTFDRRQNRDANSSLALRWSQLSDSVCLLKPISTWVYGSGDDIYARIELSREWKLDNDFRTYAETDLSLWYRQ